VIAASTLFDLAGQGKEEFSRIQFSRGRLVIGPK